MQTRTLIAALAFGLVLSLAPTVSANWQYPGWDILPEQAIEASKGVAPADVAIHHDAAETEAGPYSIVGGGPITGWQTLPPMTLAGTESPTEWRLVRVRVGLGEGSAPWGGFSLDLPMSPRLEV